MKILIRYFFRAVRLVLNPIVVVFDALTTPRGIERSPEAQAAVDAKTAQLYLYHYRTCPFCIKVRHEMKRLSLNIDSCRANAEMDCQAALLDGGGKLQVPCLRITDAGGNEQWMYESNDIIAYLRKEFAA